MRISALFDTAAAVVSKQTWYSIKNGLGDSAQAAEVFIYGDIGDYGISAASFIADLKMISAANIDVRICSAGGSVFDGMAIFSALQRHSAAVTVHIDGIAASIASVIATLQDPGLNASIVIRPPANLKQGTLNGPVTATRGTSDAAGYTLAFSTDTIFTRGLMHVEDDDTASEDPSFAASAVLYLVPAAGGDAIESLPFTWNVTANYYRPLQPAADVIETYPPVANLLTTANVGTTAGMLVELDGKVGIAAGSADAQALVISTAATDSKLADALAQVDQLTAQLLAKQSQVDALARHDAVETARANRAEKALAVADAAKWHARELAAGVIIFGLILVSLIGSALEDILRKAESFALHEAIAAGRTVEGAVLKVPALLKFASLLAIL